MLTEQEKMHKEEISEGHNCNICGKMFSGKYGLPCLKRHLKTHSDVKEFLCDQCDYSTNVHFSLKIHKLNHTGKPYQCEKCAKAFPTQGELNKHLVVHSDKRHFQCDLCGKDFKKKSYLNRHKNQKYVHNNGKNIQGHKCDECDETFSSKQPLIIHKGKHKKTADFLCDTCSKPFFDHVSLNIHRHTHKSYICNICQKSFNRISNLKVHTLIHSGETPFKCTECYQGFKEIFPMKNHMLRIHRIEYKPPKKPPKPPKKPPKKYCAEPPIPTPSLPKNMLEPSSSGSKMTPHLTHDEFEDLSYLDSAITHKFNVNISSYSEALSGKAKHYLEPPVPTPSPPVPNISPSINSSRSTPHVAPDKVEGLSSLDSAITHKFNVNIPSYSEALSGKAKHYLQPHFPALSPPQKNLEPSSNSSRSTSHLAPDELEGLLSLDSAITHKFNLNIPSKSETLSVKQFLMSTISCAKESLFSKLEEDSVLSVESKEDIVLNIKVENIDDESIECNENAIDNEYIKRKPVEAYEETPKIENTTTDEAKVKIEKTNNIYIDSSLSKKETFYNDCDKMSNDQDEAIKANKKIIKISNEEYLYAESIECNESAINNEYIKRMPVEAYEETPKIENTTNDEAKVKFEKTNNIYIDSSLFKKETFYNDCDKMSNDQDEAIKANKKIIKISNEEHLYACNKCEYKSKFKHVIKDHIRLVHNNERRFMCDLCSKTCQTKSSFRDHMERVHEKKEIICDDCGRTFFSTRNLQRHKKNVHNNENPFMCDLCSKTYQTKPCLENHIEVVHEKKEIMCDDCGRTFFSKLNLRRHKRNVHSDNLRKKSDNPGVLPYACDQCDKKYKFSVSLKNHKLVHSSLATFNCDHCTEKFISKITLARHFNDSHNNQTYNKTRIRIRPKTHMCKLCPKSFRGISELRRHEVVHTGERNHICHICNKAYSQKKSLNEHINQHLAGNLDSSGFQIYK